MEWTENPWLSKMCKMEDKNLEHISLSLLKKCVSIVAVSEGLTLQDLYF